MPGAIGDEWIIFNNIVTLLGDDFAFENDVHGRRRFARADEALAIRKGARLREAAQAIDLRRLQHRKHLVPAGLQRGRRMRVFSHGSFYSCGTPVSNGVSAKRNLRVQAMCLFDGQQQQSSADERPFDGPCK